MDKSTSFFIIPDHGHSSHSHVESAVTAASVSQESVLDLGHTLKEHMRVHRVEPEMFIGLSLCFGFVFMLLVDRVSGGHSHGSSATGMYSVVLHVSDMLARVSTSCTLQKKIAPDSNFMIPCQS